MKRSHLIASALLLLLASDARAAGGTDLRIAPKSLRTAKGVTLQADRGALVVPENRTVATSRRIEIGFLRLHSTSATPRAPLFFLQGGPGSRAVTEDPRSLDFWVPFLDVCDVVLVDQRGTNDSLLAWDWDGPPPMDFFATYEAAIRHERELHRRALAAFRKRGVDLAGYTTVESATDLDQLREALGYARVSLLGFSYGTHLTCAYIRTYGRNIESAALFGVEPPEATLKPPLRMDVQMEKISMLAAADPQIAAKVPDLMALYDRVSARLAKSPMNVRIPGPTGDTLAVPVGKFGLDLILRIDVGDATDLPVFPRLLWSIDQGDPSVLAWFLRKRASIPMGVHGMGEAMDEASGASPARRAMIAEQSKASRFADVVNFPEDMELGERFAPDLGDAFRAPLVSPVRTLIVSGGLDFNTPPSQGDDLLWGMPNATHIVVRNAGHEQTLWQNDTALPVLLDFLRGRDVSDRTITYPPLRFVPLTGPSPVVRHPSVPG